MSVELPVKAQKKSEAVLVRLTKKEKSKLEAIAEETGLAQAVLGRHAVLALMDGYERETPTPSKKKRSKK